MLIFGEINGTPQKHSRHFNFKSAIRRYPRPPEIPMLFLGDRPVVHRFWWKGPTHHRPLRLTNTTTLRSQKCVAHRMGRGGYLNKTNNSNIWTYALSLKNDPVSPKNRSHIAQKYPTTQTDTGSHKNISPVECEGPDMRERGKIQLSREAGRNQFARRFSYFFVPLNKASGGKSRCTIN